MKKVAVLDACVLFPAPVRDFLLHLARQKLYQPKWTSEIHREWMQNLMAHRPDLNQENLNRTQQLMDEAFPDAQVTKYENLKSGLTLPDLDDIHVLVAAIKCEAEYIITFNLKDFPTEYLQIHKVTSVHPDSFISQLIDESPKVATIAFQKQVSFLRNPPLSNKQVLEGLKKCGLKDSSHLIEKIL